MNRRKERKSSFETLRLHLIDDVMRASDEEIILQYAEDVGSPEEGAARMRALFDNAVLMANKDRLRAARAGAAASRTSKPAAVIPIAEARERLRQALADHAHDESFTLAARKETELSDADVLDMLQAMRELGLIK